MQVGSPVSLYISQSHLKQNVWDSMILGFKIGLGLSSNPGTLGSYSGSKLSEIQCASLIFTQIFPS